MQIDPNSLCNNNATSPFLRDLRHHVVHRANHSAARIPNFFERLRESRQHRTGSPTYFSLEITAVDTDNSHNYASRITVTTGFLLALSHPPSYRQPAVTAAPEQHNPAALGPRPQYT